jgi:endonuclease/exonuclease/phosphatase family metal-dependent hydrolase
MNKYFPDCHILMGDFNLSVRKSSDLKKLEALCQETKFMALKEITRSASNNQLDHILLEKTFKNRFYATSYHNFIKVTTNQLL